MMSQIGLNTEGGRLLAEYVERVERIREQKSQLGKDESVVMAEAKSRGLLPAGIRFAVKKRAMKPSDRQEAEAIEDLYMHALGDAMETPLFRHVGLMSVDITAREEVIEAMKKFVPANGSITIEAGGKPVRLTRDGGGEVSVTEVVEKPEMAPRAPTAPAGMTPPAPPPDVDAAGAEQLGRDAFKADVPIIKNPFPYGDDRRWKWDGGWRAASGSDGMGPSDGKGPSGG